MSGCTGFREGNYPFDDLDRCQSAITKLLWDAAGFIFREERLRLADDGRSGVGTVIWSGTVGTRVRWDDDNESTELTGQVARHGKACDSPYCQPGTIHRAPIKEARKN